jgi:hypothetical protein
MAERRKVQAQVLGENRVVEPHKRMPERFFSMGNGGNGGLDGVAAVLGHLMAGGRQKTDANRP